MVEFSDKYEGACCDGDVVKCLDEGALECLDKNNKDDIDVDYLHAKPLEYFLDKTLFIPPWLYVENWLV